MRNPIEALVDATLEPWYPRVRVVVGKGQLSFWLKDRVFVTKGVLYLRGHYVVAVGEPPVGSTWTERVDVLDGKEASKELLAKVMAHGLVQVLRRRLFLRPVMRIEFDQPADQTRRSYWEDIAFRSKAQRVEFG